MKLRTYTVHLMYVNLDQMTFFEIQIMCKLNSIRNGLIVISDHIIDNVPVYILHIL